MPTDEAREVAMGLLNLRNKNAGNSDVHEVTPPHADKESTSTENGEDQFDKMTNEINSPAKTNMKDLEADFDTPLKKCINCKETIDGFGERYDESLQQQLTPSMWKKLSLDAKKYAHHGEDLGMEICGKCLDEIGYHHGGNRESSKTHDLNALSRNLEPVFGSTTETTEMGRTREKPSTPVRGEQEEKADSGMQENKFNTPKKSDDTVSTLTSAGAKRPFVGDGSEEGLAKRIKNVREMVSVLLHYDLVKKCYSPNMCCDGYSRRIARHQGGFIIQFRTSLV